jgi:hypothetical protein
MSTVRLLVGVGLCTRRVCTGGVDSELDENDGADDPATNRMVPNKTSLRRRSERSREVPASWARKAGITGSMHDERKEASPAKTARTSVGSATLRLSLPWLSCECSSEETLLLAPFRVSHGRVTRTIGPRHIVMNS